ISTCYVPTSIVSTCNFNFFQTTSVKDETNDPCRGYHSGRSSSNHLCSFSSCQQSTASDSRNNVDWQRIGEWLGSRQVWADGKYLPGRSTSQLRFKVDFRRLWV